MASKKSSKKKKQISAGKPQQKPAPELSKNELKAVSAFLRRAHTIDFDEAEARRMLLHKINAIITG